MARDRILFLARPLDDGVVNSMIATLLFLENEDRKSPVNLYLNVPGALTKSGFALYDTMRTMAYPISTVNLGFCAHMGAFICAGGTKGRRYALPRSRFALTAPAMVMAADAEGPPIMQAEDIGREVAEVLKDRQRLARGYASLTGQGEGTIMELLKRTSYFDAEEALEFGLIDRVLTPKTNPLKGLVDGEVGRRASAPASPLPSSPLSPCLSLPLPSSFPLRSPSFSSFRTTCASGGSPALCPLSAASPSHLSRPSLPRRRAPHLAGCTCADGLWRVQLNPSAVLSWLERARPQQWRWRRGGSAADVSN
jgi:ATP-dependent Clp protease protease subunit